MGLFFVVGACAVIATSIAAPDDPPTPQSAQDKQKDDSFVERFHRAQQLLGKGKRDEEVEKILRDLLAERPEQSAVHHALAVLLQFKGKPDQATAEFKIAARLAPEEAVIQRDTGVHLLAQGRPDEAAPYFELACRLCPQDVESSVGHGAALRGLGRTAEAIVEYRRAAASDPNSVDALAGLAACLVETKPQESLALLVRAKGPWPDVVLVRGMALARLERYDEAVAELSKVIGLAPPGPAGAPYARGAAEALTLCGDAKAAGAAAKRWFDVESAAGGRSAAACFCLAATREAEGDRPGALFALDAAPVADAASDEGRAQRTLLRAAILVRADRKKDADAVLEPLAATEKDGFERSAARRLLGSLSADEFAKLATHPGRANDVAWIESLVAEATGDATAAAAARARAAELSKPRGEFPGLLVRPVPSPK